MRRLSGVLGVTNLIGLKSRVQVGDVKASIDNALRRNAELEAANIRLQAMDGEVTLSGNVHSWHERRAAEQAAWGVAGVKAVRNQLAIS